MMSESTNLFDQLKKKKPTSTEGAGQAMGADPSSELRKDEEPSLISRAFAGVGKVTTAIGKGLGEPGVPEMLARMGIAFGTSPSGIKTAGARVGEQFVQMRESQAAQKLAKRQMLTEEERAAATTTAASATKTRADADFIRATEEGGKLLAEPLAQQRFYQVKRRTVWQTVVSKMPNELRAVTDPETGETRTEWVPLDPDLAEKQVNEIMGNWVEEMILKGILPKEGGVYSEPPAPRPTEDVGAAVAGAPLPGGLEAVLGKQESRIQPSRFTPESIGAMFAPETAPAGGTGVALDINLPPLKSPGQENSKENPFVIGSTDKDIASVANLRVGDYVLHEGQLYIMTGPSNMEKVE